MKALLVVAHGSRRDQSNKEVLMLEDKLRGYCAEQYRIIYSAFLELADPLIPEGIKKCVDAGASSVIVLPYFLNSGRHVIEDIPRIVDDTRACFPDVDIQVAPHLGASDLLLELLVTTANSIKPK